MESVNTLGSEYGNLQVLVAPLPASSPLPASTASPQLNSLPAAAAAVAQTPTAKKHICKPVHKSYAKPTICSVCRQLLWFGSQGYHCAVCKKDYHKACLPSYNKTHRCKPILMTYMLPTSCTLCSRMLTGFHNQGYHCTECGNNYHACCRAPNSSTSLSPPCASSAGKKRVCAQCRWPGKGHQCDVCRRFVCKNCMPRSLHAPAGTRAVLGLEETSSDGVKCRVCDDCARRTFSPVEAVHRVTAVADERTPRPVQ